MSNPHPTYHLRVTAGPTYSLSNQQIVPVNTPTPLHISSSSLSADLSLRIASYRGLPTSSPSTSPYFSHPTHASDRYSIGFSFTPKSDIPGDELVFGNDVEHPVRDKLPPGFNAALRLVKWAIDPGLDGDVYADSPYLYGPLLSSINVLRIGRKSSHASTGKGQAGGHEEEEQDDEEDENEEDDGVITEGADGEDAEEIRKHLHIPAEGPKRMKHFLTEAHKKAFTFEAGRRYRCDFFNGYLDFNDLSLKLPGITMQLMSFWDGQPLRYVLKHKSVAKGIDKELLVITFTLIAEEDLEAEKEKWEGEHAGKGSEKQHEAKTQKMDTEQKGGSKHEEEDVD